ncbi:hypothetical protein BDV59DRAFT_186050 [Aspergillus ambiguus]|uniref:uncharacterized protein n=1 Tax=Aspergillus ambiguus TaxID=176160 RepID=UPI003CCD2A47
MAPLSEDPTNAVSPAENPTEGDGSLSTVKITPRVPVHPISQLQGPFEESILETLEDVKEEWEIIIDAQSRRRDLLENPIYVRLCGRKWRQRHGERYHPFWKVTAQMSFGINLLVKELAKSDAGVLKILQCHVDEMDGFLGRTTEDFLIIQIDVRTRIQYLSLPLENLDVFDEMLEDRNFRISMIDYNDKIEHAISRFTTSIQDTLKDLQKGREAIGALWQYLKQSAVDNAPLSSHLIAIYNAMLANTEGWNTAFSKLQRKGIALQAALSQLGLAITEMQRRVGIASRKEVVSFLHTPSVPQRASSLRQRLLEKGRSIKSPGYPASEKPLPSDPNPLGPPYTPPPPRVREPRRLTQKSVPNLRASRRLFSRDEQSAPDRTKPADRAEDSLNPIPSVPKLHRRLSRRFSKARLSTKKSFSDIRPATAPTRVTKSHSISVEQTTFHKDKKEPTASPALSRKDRPSTSQAPRKPETMKSQLLHHIRSDRVIDAWESTTQKKISRRISQKKKDAPWSKFRAKTANVPGSAGDLQTKLFEEDLERQMTWLQEESEALNTYSLKPKRDVAPRIHVLSVHMTLAQESELEGKDDGAAKHEEKNDDDAQSIITALPSVPPVVGPLPQTPRSFKR